MNITIRRMGANDSNTVAVLLPDLGYSASPEQVRARMQALRKWPDQEAFVAEVQALVVAASEQRKGIGKALLRHAVDWAYAHGYVRVRLRSGLHRDAAHRFYEAVGFSRSKRSYAFEVLKAQYDA